MTLAQIRPHHRHVLVLLSPATQRTASGLFRAEGLPPMPTVGKVLKAGPQCRDVHVGDVVTFSPDVGDLIAIGSHVCVFVNEVEIAAIVSRKEPNA